jgi:hypothetical protein
VPKAPKTKLTEASVPAFLATLDRARRTDCEQLDAWMEAATGAAGKMYGTAIVGYGDALLHYADGREAPWFKLGFSPRKQALTIYGVLVDGSAELLSELGKHDTGKGCLYVKRLSDVRADTLRALIRNAART